MDTKNIVFRQENISIANKTADPTLPVMDDSTFLTMPTASEIENISRTIVSTIPISDECPFLTLPAGIDADIWSEMDASLPMVKEPSSILASSKDTDSSCFNEENINYFESISKYKFPSETATDTVYSSSKDTKRNLELALKTIEKHKMTIKRLQQTNRQLQKRIIELELLNGVKSKNSILNEDD